MTSQVHVHIPSSEPSVVVKISQTEVEPETYRLPYPPELTLKRRATESFLQTQGYLKKRRKILRRDQETIIDCPCLPPPTYDVAMTEPASNLDSVYSTLPPTPPTPNTQGNESHTRRPLQVTEMIEKVNARLRRLFHSRRGSTEDEYPPLDPTVTQRSGISDSTSRLSKDLAGMGLAALPNISEYFNVNGEVGPSCFYGTTDWDTFQATLQAQRRNIIQAEWNNDLHYDGDSDLEQTERFRRYDTRTERCGERERKDSQFSFTDFLKPRRFSKVDKGKGRMVCDDETRSISQDQPLHSPYQDASFDAVRPSTVRTGVLLRAPLEENQILVSKEPAASSFQVGIGSLQSSAPVSPKDYNTPRRPEPTTRKASVRLVPPTRYRPRDKRRSSTSSTASSSSVSSFGSHTPATRPSRTPRRLARNIVNTLTTDSNKKGADGRSEPISIPPSSYHNRRRLSAIAIGPARPINDSPTLPLSLISSSTIDLLSHGYRPDTTPSSPHLNPTTPTLTPSPEAMQALHLGPPQRTLLQRSVSSGSCMFHVSVEQLSTTTATHSISPLDGPSTVVKKGDLSRDSEDEPDFSITHPAPPSPLASASSPLADVPSPVKRRTGSLEGSGDLRAVYIEQGKASVINNPLRRRGKRKSLQGRLWWDESPPEVYL